MIECSKICKDLNVSCPEENKDCRYWIDFEDDLNCTFIAIDNNQDRPMTLRDIGLRLGLTHPRIDQIERKASKRLTKKLKKEDLFP